MADLLEQTSLYRIKQIEIAEAEYYRQLIKILDRIEKDIVSLADQRLTTDKGKLIRDARREFDKYFINSDVFVFTPIISPLNFLYIIFNIL